MRYSEDTGRVLAGGRWLICSGEGPVYVMSTSEMLAIYLSIVASLIGASAQVATNHAAQPLTLNVSVDLSLSPVGAGSSRRSLVQLVKPMAARSVQIFPVSSVEQEAKGAVDSLW